MNEPSINNSPLMPQELFLPGINYGISEKTYFTFDACSNSRLSDMLDSPAECKFNIDHPAKPTPAMILGSAVDTLVFTPNLFTDRFQVFGQCQAQTVKGGDCSNTANRIIDGRQLCGIHSKGQVAEDNGLIVLSRDEHDVVDAMRNAVYLHSTANQLLSECDDFQVSLLWGFNRMPCKARLDGAAWDLDGGTIIDLKKTNPRGANDSTEAFSRALYNYGAFRQAAFYRWGAQTLGKSVNNFVFIVVDEAKVRVRLKSDAEDKRLNECVNVYRLRDESLYYGELQLAKLLAEYHHCWTTDEWPYSEEIIDISIPTFAEKAIERSVSAL